MRKVGQFLLFSFFLSDLKDNLRSYQLSSLLFELLLVTKLNSTYYKAILYGSKFEQSNFILLYSFRTTLTLSALSWSFFIFAHIYSRKLILAILKAIKAKQLSFVKP